MRDFRDAKAMAHTMRAALAAKGIKITVGQSLELVAEAFGVADWNTLSASILAAGARSPDAGLAAPAPGEAVSGGARVGFSHELQATLHRAVTLAKERKQEHATLEHLLLALTDDADAQAVMFACDVDPGELRVPLASYLDDELPHLTTDLDGPRPSASFQRVIQRAVLHVQTSGRSAVTGAQLLVAIFSEGESRAAKLLDQRAMSRDTAVSFIIRDAVKRSGDAAT